MFFAYPELAEQSVEMGAITFRPFNMEPTERFCLAAWAQVRRPRRIFEFGTYDGATALLLARAAPDAEIVTIDYPPEALPPEAMLEAQQLDVAGGTGSAFASRPEQARITQLYGDTRFFDFSPYFGTMDMIVVDANHEYQPVRSDSENALRMLAPGGLIVWDDYGSSFPGVVKAVDDLATERGLRVLSIRPTGFALYDASRQAHSELDGGDDSAFRLREE